MPTAAAAMTAVASQPSVLSQGPSVNSPMTSRREPISMIIDHDRHGHDAVDDGAPEQRLDRIERREVERRADAGRRGDRAVEGLGARPGRCASPTAPLQRLADRIGGGARQHRHGQQAGADDAEREDREGEFAGDRPQRLGGLRRGLDIGDAVRVQRRRGRQHDEQRDDVGEAHADERVELDAAQLAAAPARALRQAAWLSGSSFSSSTSSAACQKNR